MTSYKALSFPFYNEPGMWTGNWTGYTPHLSTVLAMASNLLNVSCAAEGSERREALAFKEL